MIEIHIKNILEIYYSYIFVFVFLTKNIFIIHEYINSYHII